MSNILPMPVAAAIINGARIVDISVKKTDIDRSDVVRAWVREATFVQAQPAADMLLSAADTLEKSADYPPLRAPLPLIWIEWTRDPQMSLQAITSRSCRKWTRRGLTFLTRTVRARKALSRLCASKEGGW